MIFFVRFIILFLIVKHSRWSDTRVVRLIPEHLDLIFYSLTREGHEVKCSGDGFKHKSNSSFNYPFPETFNS